MKTFPLYPLLLLCVLLVAGCGEDSTDARVHEPTAAPREAQQAAPPEVTPEPTDDEARQTILVLGNSLAAGYGLDPAQSFPAHLQEKIDSLGWDYEVINAGLSGETTAGGLRRIDWLLRRPVDVLILELGGNDGLRGIPPEVTKENLAAIIEKVRAQNPEVRVVLAGMQIPPNLGQAYTEQFRRIYPALAEEQDAVLIPFLLEGVGGVDALMQPDGLHPTAEGQALVAENVWEVLEPELLQMQASS